MRDLNTALDSIWRSIAKNQAPKEQDLKIVYDNKEVEKGCLKGSFYKEFLFETLVSQLKSCESKFNQAAASRQGITKWQAIHNAFAKKHTATELHQKIYGPCWTKEYTKYLNTASEKLDKIAKRDGFGTSGAREAKSFKYRPETYKIQCGLNALGVLLENEHNVCVAVGYKSSKTDKLYVGANVDPDHTGYTDRLNQIKEILLAVKGCTKVGEKFIKKIRNPKEGTETFSELIKASSPSVQAQVQALPVYATTAESTIIDPKDKARLLGTICYVPAIQQMIETKKLPEIAIAEGNKQIHAEIKVVTTIEDETQDLDGLYLGISKVCCAKCTGYFYSLIKEDEKKDTLSQTLSARLTLLFEQDALEACPWAIENQGLIIYRDSHCGVSSWEVPSNIKHLHRAVGSYNVSAQEEKELRKIISNFKNKTNKPMTSAERGISVESTTSNRARIILENKKSPSVG
jgi:hypothetical protein